MPQDKMVTLRIPMDVWKEAQQLTKVLKKDKEYRLVRVTPSLVLRLCIERGLEVFAEEYDL
ncbi:MAG: hypothetical protein R3A47_06355 [Polyangiales bacterium]